MRNIRIFLFGHELRNEMLHSFLSQQATISIVGKFNNTDGIERMLDVAQHHSRRAPIDAVLIDGDGDFGEVCQNISYLAAAQLRCIVVAWLSSSQIEVLRHVGVWGYISTAFSTHHLMCTLRTVAVQGNPSFDLPHSQAHMQRQLVFSREHLHVLANRMGWLLTATDIEIIEHFARGDSRELATHLGRTPGTIRTRLHHIYQFLQMLVDHDVSDRITAFQILLQYGILVYQ